MQSIDQRIGLIGAAVTLAAAGCGAPTPPDSSYLPSPIPEHSLLVGPQLPEATNLTNEQKIRNEIARRSTPDQNEIANFEKGPEAHATFPPDGDDLFSEKEFENMGIFLEKRLNTELSVMMSSSIPLIREAGEVLNRDIPGKLQVDIDMSNLAVEPMNLYYDPSFNPPYETPFSAGFILHQSSREFAVNLVRLSSGYRYVQSLADPFSLTDENVLEFVSTSYADEIEAYFQLAAKTGYFSIPSDENFERLAAVYSEYGRDSDEFESVIKSVMNLLEEPSNGGITS